jgi:hypothetical protein
MQTNLDKIRQICRLSGSFFVFDFQKNVYFSGRGLPFIEGEI